MSDMKSCGARECFIKNNWFGASPNHPGNRENYNKCVRCNTPPKIEIPVTELQSFIRGLVL